MRAISRGALDPQVLDAEHGFGRIVAIDYDADVSSRCKVRFPSDEVSVSECGRASSQSVKFKSMGWAGLGLLQVHGYSLESIANLKTARADAGISLGAVLELENELLLRFPAVPLDVTRRVLIAQNHDLQSAESHLKQLEVISVSALLRIVEDLGWEGFVGFDVLNKRQQFLEAVCRVLPHRKGPNGAVLLLRQHVLGVLSFFSSGTKEEFIELLFSLHAQPKLAPHELVAIQNELSSESVSGKAISSSAAQRRMTAVPFEPAASDLKEKSTPLKWNASANGGSSHCRLQSAIFIALMRGVECGCKTCSAALGTRGGSPVESQRVGAGLGLEW